MMQDAELLRAVAAPPRQPAHHRPGAARVQDTVWENAKSDMMAPGTNGL